MSLVALLIDEASAENCWMIGCGGRVGYVYLPISLFPPNPSARFNVNEHDCGPMGEFMPFQGNGLPDVNSVVTVARTGVELLTEDSIQTHPGSFRGISFDISDADGSCRAFLPKPLDANGSPMHEGAKLRILAYRTFVNQTSAGGKAGAVTKHEQILFAMVLVINDL